MRKSPPQGEAEGCLSVLGASGLHSRTHYRPSLDSHWYKLGRECTFLYKVTNLKDTPPEADVLGQGRAVYSSLSPVIGPQLPLEGGIPLSTQTPRG